MIDRPDHVIGPLGERLTLKALPPARSVRWTVRRKAEVLAAVRGGLLTLDEACDRYGLAPEEFAAWEWSIQHHGLDGLRITRLQEYRAEYEKLGGY